MPLFQITTKSCSVWRSNFLLFFFSLIIVFVLLKRKEKWLEKCIAVRILTITTDESNEKIGWLGNFTQKWHIERESSKFKGVFTSHGPTQRQFSTFYLLKMFWGSQRLWTEVMVGPIGPTESQPFQPLHLSTEIARLVVNLNYWFH